MPFKTHNVKHDTHQEPSPQQFSCAISINPKSYSICDGMAKCGIVKRVLTSRSQGYSMIEIRKMRIL